MVVMTVILWLSPLGGQMGDASLPYWTYIRGGLFAVGLGLVFVGIRMTEYEENEEP